MLRTAVSGGGYRAAVVVSCRQSALSRDVESSVVSRIEWSSVVSVRGYL